MATTNDNFFGETKTATTPKKTKTGTKTKTKSERAAKTVTVRNRKTNDTIRVILPRNPLAAYELGRLMSRYT